MTFEYIKDPDEVLELAIDWTIPLNASEPPDSIALSAWACSTALAIDSETHADPLAKVIISGGGKLNTFHKLINTITTAAGRIYERTILVELRSK